MGGGQSTIVQGEDILDKYDAGIIDLSYACKKDVICPPSKFISKFTNYCDKYQDKNLNIYKYRDKHLQEEENNNYMYFIIFTILLFILLLKYI